MRRLILLLACGAVGMVQAQTPGPTILSRGVGTVMQGGSLARLRPYVSLSGVYDTGLTPVAVDESGKIPQEAAYGAEAEIGLAGYKNWRRTLLGLDYRGNVRHYNRKTYFDGSDHALSLGVTYRLSSKLAMTVRQAAGSQSRDQGLMSSFMFFDPNYASVPSNEMFDARTNYISTLGDMTYTVGSRLSFNAGGTGMMVRRRSVALVGVNGWTARGDVQYRLAHNISLGSDYSFTHYDYTRAFGASDVHTVAVDLATRLGRRWNLALRLGGARVEILGLRRVAVDPIIAAIMGRIVGLEVLYRVSYLPAMEARISRSIRRTTVSLGGTAGTNPGNGMLLMSRHQAGTAGLSHTATRRWNVGLSAGISQQSDLMQRIKYRTYNAGGGFTYQMNDWAHIVGRYDARRYDAGEALRRRMTHRVTLGFAFSPGDLPLSLW